MRVRMGLSGEGEACIFAPGQAKKQAHARRARIEEKKRGLLAHGIDDDPHVLGADLHQLDRAFQVARGTFHVS